MTFADDDVLLEREPADTFKKSLTKVVDKTDIGAQFNFKSYLEVER
jgi:hypothetical protein